MKKLTLLVLLILLGISLLPAQSFLSVNPSILQFSSAPGHTDIKFTAISNTDTLAHDFSILDLPLSLSGSIKNYYPYDGDYADLLTNTIGSENHPVFTADRWGNPHQALAFDGNDLIENEVYLLENEFSFSFWANPSSPISMLSQGYYNYGLQTGYLLFPSWGGYVSRGGLGVALGTNGIMIIEHAAGYMPVLLAYPASLSGWKHYTVVFSAHVPKLYIDGVLISTGIASQRAVTYMSYQWGWGAYGHYNGLFDELLIYDTALNQAQVTDAYTYNRGEGFSVQPLIGTLAAGQTSELMFRMTDSGLPNGFYSGQFQICQRGIPHAFVNLPYTLSVSPTGIPSAPTDLTLSALSNGSILLQWQPVTIDTQGNPINTTYLVYTGHYLQNQNSYRLIGVTNSTQFEHLSGNTPEVGICRFYYVVAYSSE